MASFWRWQTLGIFAALVPVVSLAIVRGQNAAPTVVVSLLQQDAQQAHAKSAGCVTCHQNVGDPHCKDTLHLGCCDCHGGNPTATVKELAHVAPRFPKAWPTSANPVRSYTLLNHESPEFIRFVNPGDLRV